MPRKALVVVGRILAFYLLTVSLTMAAVAVHEYSHLAAHDGLVAPDVHFSASVAASKSELMSHDAMRVAGIDYLVEQPKNTMIVFYPNVLVHAFGLGLPPPQMYDEDGVLAMTFFRLRPEEIEPVVAHGGQVDAASQGTPLVAAVGLLAASLGWSVLRPNRLNRSLAWVYAIELGDAGHHATAWGMDPSLFYGFSWMATLAAISLACMRGPSFRLVTSPTGVAGNGASASRVARHAAATFRPTGVPRPATPPRAFVAFPFTGERPAPAPTPPRRSRPVAGALTIHPAPPGTATLAPSAALSVRRGRTQPLLATPPRPAWPVPT